MGNKRVLFVCTYHGARARIAEAFTREYAGGKIDAFSSCFEAGKIGKLPVSVMNETGFEISAESPKTVFERYADREGFDYVITLCHEATTEQCPVFKINIDTLYQKKAERISWSIQDFKSLSGTDEEKLEGARCIRDNIKAEVNLFLKKIGIESGGYHGT